MGKCAQCGNNYDQSFEVTMGGRTLTFDSFECAICRARAGLPPLRRKVLVHGDLCGPVKCAQCGNNYDQSFEVTMGGRTLTFNSFECAICRARAGLPPLRRKSPRAWGPVWSGQYYGG